MKPILLTLTAALALSSCSLSQRHDLRGARGHQPLHVEHAGPSPASRAPHVDEGDVRLLLAEALTTLRHVESGDFDDSDFDVEVMELLSNDDPRATLLVDVLREWIAIRRAETGDDATSSPIDSATTEASPALADRPPSHARIGPPAPDVAPPGKSPRVGRPLSLFDARDTTPFGHVSGVHAEHAGDSAARQRLVDYLKKNGLDAYARGDAGEALRLWRQAARLAPDDRELVKFLKRARRTIGRD